MTVARGFVEELFVREGEQRAVAVRPDENRDERFPFRRRVPRPGKHEFLVRHDLAVDAVDLMPLAVGALRGNLVAAADAHVSLHASARDIRRRKPPLYLFWAAPRGEDFRGRRVEAPLDGETWFRCDGGHGSSSKNAARLSRRSVQNFV